jgi:hypothetical protein
VRAYEVTVESEEEVAVENYPVSVERGWVVLHV